MWANRNKYLRDDLTSNPGLTRKRTKNMSVKSFEAHLFKKLMADGGGDVSYDCTVAFAQQLQKLADPAIHKDITKMMFSRSWYDRFAAEFKIKP